MNVVRVPVVGVPEIDEKVVKDVVGSTRRDRCGETFVSKILIAFVRPTLHWLFRQVVEGTDLLLKTPVRSTGRSDFSSVLYDRLFTRH